MMRAASRDEWRVSASWRGAESLASSQGDRRWTVPQSLPYVNMHINLHVLWANGDLVAELDVPYNCFINAFLEDLDDHYLQSQLRGSEPFSGSIEPSDEIVMPAEGCFVEWSGETWHMMPEAHVLELVWGDKVLYWSQQFGYYVEADGMSTREPVHVTLVKTSAQTLFAATRGISHLFR